MIIWAWVLFGSILSIWMELTPVVGIEIVFQKGKIGTFNKSDSSKPDIPA